MTKVLSPLIEYNQFVELAPKIHMNKDIMFFLLFRNLAYYIKFYKIFK